ncbi:katanin p80 WD40 repeat-containing subunit B1 isoform X2 [Neocloeon triangulifer]|uniref:katanin p80 WD40 repeat-containing subunit B1 isoform X2 n=1 Tax=Neocloeon triangulifer TaxID=2078957 RepID=UPI00286EDC64|nr:katanin p80 WD40 repeat-containing subunit B1 isoform X2 [Neocloeon triangulifer]
MFDSSLSLDPRIRTKSLSRAADFGMAATKRAWQLQNFTAHDAYVTSLTLGRKSTALLATGGDDKKINVWAIGKPECILSLTGLSTSLECMQFGITEETICAGSKGGAMKIWDLEAAKVTRTLTGHKAGIKCLDHHPYGDFLVSGSSDTHIKVWDIRRKGCIYTYKGHDKNVSYLKFSPDGQWVASAGEDSVVKLWDIRTGKCLAVFTEHTAPVLTVQYHPHEFLLASGSADRTSNFWDLEHFSIVSTSDKDAGPIRSILFSPNGECMYAASQDCLRVLGWEPSRTLDIVPVGWGKVQDMVIAPNNHILAASYFQCNVSVHMVDLNRLAPLISESPDADEKPIEAGPFVKGSPTRKSFSKDKVPLRLKMGLNAPKSLMEESSSSSGCGGTTDQDDFSEFDEKDAFKAARSYASLSPQILRKSFSAESGGESPPVVTKLPQPKFQIGSPARRKMSENAVLNNRFLDTNFEVQVGGRLRHSPSEPTLHQPPPSSKVPPSIPPSQHNKSNNRSQLPPKARGHDFYSSTNDLSPRKSRNEPTLRKPLLPLGKIKTERSPPPPLLPRGSPRDNARKIPRKAMTVPQSPVSDTSDDSFSMLSLSEKKHSSLDYVPMLADKPAGLDMGDFLPTGSFSPRFGGGLHPEMSEAEGISNLLREHDQMTTVLRSRSQNLQIVFQTLANKDLKAAVDCAIAIQDLSLMVDLLSVISLRPQLWSLDLCALVLPTIGTLLQSKYETYMNAACSALRLILRNFGSVIKNNSSGGSAIGVDISREERRAKSKKCLDHLVAIHALLLKRQTLQGPLGNTFRELQAQMATALDF